MLIEPTLGQRILSRIRPLIGKPVRCVQSDAFIRRISARPTAGEKIIRGLRKLNDDMEQGREIKVTTVAMPIRYIQAGERLMAEERAKQDKELT